MDSQGFREEVASQVACRMGRRQPNKDMLERVSHTQETKKILSLRERTSCVG